MVRPGMRAFKPHAHIVWSVAGAPAVALLLVPANGQEDLLQGLRGQRLYALLSLPSCRRHAAPLARRRRLLLSLPLWGPCLLLLPLGITLLSSLLLPQQLLLGVADAGEVHQVLMLVLGLLWLGGAPAAPRCPAAQSEFLRHHGPSPLALGLPHAAHPTQGLPRGLGLAGLVGAHSRPT
jgi:hypothetical protein